MSNIQKSKGEFMEKLKNTDKKASAQRERLEKLPMSLLSFQKKNNPSLVEPN